MNKVKIVHSHRRNPCVQKHEILFLLQNIMRTTIIFILYYSEIMGDPINISSCADTTVFVLLLFSVYFVVSTLFCNLKYEIYVSNCIYQVLSIPLNVCLSYIGRKFRREYTECNVLNRVG